MVQEPDEELERLRVLLGSRYRIEREIGRGATARVYLAEEPRHSRRVALKVLRQELAATLGQERFLREIKTTAGLRHPNILPLFDSGEVDGFLFYTMPYVEGESLRHRLTRERQIPIDEALGIGVEVADALGLAHSHDVVHRDIKPENILLDAGHAVVADFGIAKAITESGGTLTYTGIAIGTPQYMSPEQAEGNKALDGRSDMYSLACVLYEMLAGDPPFTGSLPIAIVRKKMFASATPLRHIRESVPIHVEAAIARALARVPADRFRTMKRFVDALMNPDSAAAKETRLQAPVESPVRQPFATSVPISLKPLDDEIDSFGVSHPGRALGINQDRFLICSVRRDLYVHQTNLVDGSRLPHGGQRRAFIGMIADGLGRGNWGEEASRLAIEVAAQYVVHNISSYSMADDAAERSFLDALRQLAVQCHANVEQRARENPSGHGMQTSLLMWVGIWPRAYLLQAGDSRCYILRKGRLLRFPDDLTTQRSGAPTLPPGGQGSAVVTRMDQVWGDVGLLCSKGLTMHVGEERIFERLASMTSAKQVCEDLLEDALEGGGGDNITVIAARAQPVVSESVPPKDGDAEAQQ